VLLYLSFLILVALFKIQDYGIVRGVSKDITESQHELYRRALSLELGRHAAVVFRVTPRG
jgi:transcription initiation factor TFIIH subunit 1